MWVDPLIALNWESSRWDLHQSSHCTAGCNACEGVASLNAESTRSREKAQLALTCVEPLMRSDRNDKQNAKTRCASDRVAPAPTLGLLGPDNETATMSNHDNDRDAGPCRFICPCPNGTAALNLFAIDDTHSALARPNCPKKRKSAFGLAVHQKICIDTTPNQHGRDGLEVDRTAVENVRAATKERVASQKCKAVVPMAQVKRAKSDSLPHVSNCC